MSVVLNIPEPDDPGHLLRQEAILDLQIAAMETMVEVEAIEAELENTDDPKQVGYPRLLAAMKSAKEAAGAQVIIAAIKNGRIDLVALMEQLGRMEIGSLLIEGGGRVIGSALAAGIVDKLFLFYAPKLLGGDDGIPICRGTGPERMQDSIAVHDLEVFRFDEDVMLQGYLKPR